MRWPLVVTVAVSALALAACGGQGGSPGTTTSVAPGAALVAAGLEPLSGCYVTVFLTETVTKADVASVQQRLLASRAISEVSFVSKALELRRFALTNPKAAKGMHVNPFPDRFEVVPRTNGAVFSIIGDFATHGGPITNVKPSEGCRAGLG